MNTRPASPEQRLPAIDIFAPIGEGRGVSWQGGDLVPHHPSFGELTGVHLRELVDFFGDDATTGQKTWKLGLDLMNREDEFSPPYDYHRDIERALCIPKVIYGLTGGIVGAKRITPDAPSIYEPDFIAVGTAWDGAVVIGGNFFGKREELLSDYRGKQVTIISHPSPDNAMRMFVFNEVDRKAEEIKVNADIESAILREVEPWRDRAISYEKYLEMIHRFGSNVLEWARSVKRGEAVEPPEVYGKEGLVEEYKSKVNEKHAADEIRNQRIAEAQAEIVRLEAEIQHDDELLERLRFEIYEHVVRQKLIAALSSETT